MVSLAERISQLADEQDQLNAKFIDIRDETIDGTTWGFLNNAVYEGIEAFEELAKAHAEAKKLGV